MAFRALQRRRLVEKNLFAGNLSHSLVTKSTFDIGVPALERELRSLIVIKGRRHPSRHIVTIGARRLSGLCDKLAAVWVHVAFLALLGCSLKLRLFRAR